MLELDNASIWLKQLIHSKKHLLSLSTHKQSIIAIPVWSYLQLPWVANLWPCWFLPHPQPVQTIRTSSYQMLRYWETKQLWLSLAALWTCTPSYDHVLVHGMILCNNTIRFAFNWFTTMDARCHMHILKCHMDFKTTVTGAGSINSVYTSYMSTVCYCFRLSHAQLSLTFLWSIQWHSQAHEVTWACARRC